MAYFAGEDEYYQEEVEGPFLEQMEERLAQALGHHVQDSVNQALIKALKPFTLPLVRYGERELMGPTPTGSGARDPQPRDSGFASKGPLSPLSSAEILSQMASAVINDHEYSSDLHPPSENFLPPSGAYKDLSQSSESHSDSDISEPKQVGKRKRKAKHYAADDVNPQGNLLFDPENIIHTRSTEWFPCAEVVHYVQDRLCKGFDKDIRSTLRSECPRPSLWGKVADTLELDPSVATFLKKFTKDPKKWLDRSWKGCQDKMLDLSGPITKILELAVHAKETNTLLDPQTVLEWAQRAICLLGNVNCAMSTERRKSFLMRIDPKLAELAPSEPWPMDSFSGTNLLRI
ncbi:hypothetical protein NDU88_009321 [Pleurodeles waltl]|uniref:Uncharacterized protein n=1 Tax=Pleurodeles waltl TaxID=8319 RepID=A0AAV7PRR9_PLEWA|nr:hypothetical protein NDU88_009321 [Pleurodeles waltl]